MKDNKKPGLFSPGFFTGEAFRQQDQD